MEKKIIYALTRQARHYIYTVLKECFKLTPEQVKLRVSWKELPDLLGLARLVKIKDKKGEFHVILHPKIATNDGLFKIVCAHEACHIAYWFSHHTDDGKTFWEGLVAFVPRAILILKDKYGTNDEFIAMCVESLLMLPLLPPPTEEIWLETTNA